MPHISNTNPAAKMLDDCLCEIAAIKQVPRWQREAENRLARQLANILRDAEQEALAELRRFDRPPSTDLQRRRIADKLSQYTPALQEAVASAAIAAGITASQLAARPLIAAGREAISASRPAQRIEQALREKIFVATEGTMQRIVGDVTEVLADGYAEGKGILDAGQDLRAAFEKMRDFEKCRLSFLEAQKLHLVALGFLNLNCRGVDRFQKCITSRA
jgi:hypothetical protein